ncbi:HNH endonuclease signature motif containing protein [Microbacterium stercoris]|uniref:DUF222 domain-containing protein n=1 Tax=Microbacterium stercoris TaxID=2820289 RepID=A0A939QMX0_9MICO|nr:HNH endonuclease signature motif containing protein [Microbacterium stercoris]MBO3664662.1 DUF222 domain-containing protein [Microbacterium stercoris]
MPTFTDSPPLTWDFTPDERSRARAGIAELAAIRTARAVLDAREARAQAGLMQIALDLLGRMPRASDYAFPVRSMAAEVALALKESPRTMEARLDSAYDLVVRFPATTTALEEGRITQRHAREIVEAGSRIADDSTRAAFEADILPIAERSTPSRMKRQAVQVAERHDPEPIQERHDRARADRRVYVVDLPEGMAELRILTTAVRARAMHDRLTAQAKVVARDNRAAARAQNATTTAPTAAPEATGTTTATTSASPAAPRVLAAIRPTGAPEDIGRGIDAPAADTTDAPASSSETHGARENSNRATIDADAITPDSAPTEPGLAAPAPADSAHTESGAPTEPGTDDRRLGQLRADLATDLLFTGEPTAHDLDAHITATVEVTIPVTTLLGLDDGPALLDGYGPIDPDTARRLAARSPGWERVFLHPDTRALLTVDHYTPTAAQRRLLLARDKTCRLPGCATKAKHTDIDHTVPYSAGGPTSVHNLACLCEGHHMMKHHAPWTFHNHGHGHFTITTPCGYTYNDDPPAIHTTPVETSAPF